MIKSMTGYGRYEKVINGRLIGAEVRSVNHRYFEYTARLPKGYGFLEGQLKSFVQSKVSRGKLDIIVTIEPTRDAPISIEINESLADSYMQALKRLARQFDLKEEVDVFTIASYSEVLNVQREQENEEQLWLAVSQVVEKALADMLAMREQEGQNLKQDILNHAANIEQLVNEIKVRSPQTVEAYKERLKVRMQELTNDREYNETRLYMEITLFADKISVVEETVRLCSHVDQFRNMLGSAEAVGRKLDFLVQEMNREANTIGSKALDAQIAYMVVDMKAEIEKIREQIQNIE